MAVSMNKDVQARMVRLYMDGSAGVGYVDVIEHSDRGVISVSSSLTGDFLSRERHEAPFLEVVADLVSTATRDRAFTHASEADASAS